MISPDWLNNLYNGSERENQDVSEQWWVYETQIIVAIGSQTVSVMYVEGAGRVGEIQLRIKRFLEISWNWFIINRGGTCLHGW